MQPKLEQSHQTRKRDRANAAAPWRHAALSQITRMIAGRQVRRKLRLFFPIYTLACVLLALVIAACTSIWQSEQDTLERMAALGALAAVYEKGRMGDLGDLGGAALRDASANGFDPESGDVMIVNNPPTSGRHAGAPAVVEVIVKRPAASGPGSYLMARAAAMLDGTGRPCLLAVDLGGAGSAVSGGTRNDRC